jgi:hypothetical protein
MIAEIERLQSSDEAADWVYSNLPAKNALTPEDGDVVEAAFQERFFAIDGIQPDPLSLEERASNDSDQSAPRRGPALDASKAPAPATNHRKRRVASKAIRLRDKEHRKFVATQPCVVCGRTPAESHHLRFA